MFQIMQAQDIWSKADLLSVMSTCKTLYRSGIPFLLQRPVYITDTNVKSFCDYMLSDITFRGPALRHFYLQHLPPQHEQVRRFPAIFQHAIHLVTFSVAESEQLLEEVPEMIDIVSSLLKVTELEVWLAGHRSIELFRRLDQRLLRLGASLCDTNEEFELQEPLIAPPHLETLVLDHIDIRLFTEACPSLQQLEVGGASLNESLETLVRFCPHLRCLILKGQPDHWWEELDLVDTAHTFNTQYVQSEVQQWTKLDRVDGPLHLLYSLAIPCQVHDLRVTPYRVKHITAAFWLFTVLMEYRPQTLMLEMDSDDLDMDIFGVMHSLESSTSELKSFAMHVTLSDDFGHMDRLLVRFKYLLLINNHRPPFADQHSTIHPMFIIG